MRRVVAARRLLAAGCLLLSTLLTIGCGTPLGAHAGQSPHARSDAAGPRMTTIRLPAGTYPDFLAFSGNRTLWITEGGGNAIARLDSAGHVTQYRIPGDDNSPGDIVEGPDGEMWFAGFEVLGRISATGQITGWSDDSEPDIGLPDALTVGPDGEVWYTNSSKISQFTPWGDLRSFAIPSGQSGVQMPGITSGPDGAAWFTEIPGGSSGRDAIGRLTLAGHYTQFRLPALRSDPMRITVGPDDALWFTERAGYRIGRITTSGKISEFSLPPGVSPYAITSGPDRDLWFTTLKGIGRITTSGHVTLWAVPRATNLNGIAAAPDGSLWAADGPRNELVHFTPPR
jgi:virginiamycin B lyase